MANFVIEKVSELYNSAVDKLQEASCFSDLLQKAEEKTGIPRSYVATGITTSILLFIVLGYGAIILFDLIVVLYPAYRSFHAMETKDIDMIIQYMKYWIVFGIFRAAEHIGDSLFWWLPGYLFLKFLFLVWCFAPIDKNGSIIIYETYIRPIFLNNTETVDNVVKSVKSLANHASAEKS